MLNWELRVRAGDVISDNGSGIQLPSGHKMAVWDLGHNGARREIQWSPRVRSGFKLWVGAIWLLEESSISGLQVSSCYNFEVIGHTWSCIASDILLVMECFMTTKHLSSQPYQRSAFDPIQVKFIFHTLLMWDTKCTPLTERHHTLYTDARLP